MPKHICRPLPTTPPIPLAFPVPKRPSHKELHESSDAINARQSGIRNLFEIPLFRARDTSLRSLYRLYDDDLFADRLTLMICESEHFFRHGSER